jgi:hypothetical protein
MAVAKLLRGWATAEWHFKIILCRPQFVIHLIDSYNATSLAGLVVCGEVAEYAAKISDIFGPETKSQVSAA